MMDSIIKSVGRGGVNDKRDVEIVQKMLNLAIEGVNLSEDGKIGPRTISAIDYFQSNVLWIKPDGRIDPNGSTIIKLQQRADAPMCRSDRIDLPAPGTSAPLKESDFQDAANKIGCEVAAIRAVADVESKGDGFLPSKRPKILFEAHVFSRLTYHCFDNTYPDISSKTWNKKLYKGEEDEYPRLMKAMAINRDAALQSASWGRFQIMGFNYKASGFPSVEDYVTAMFESEGKHLGAFVAFIKASNLTGYMKDKKWGAFAAGYNGPDYAQNAYDTKMDAAYKKYADKK